MLNFEEQVMKKRWDLSCSCCDSNEWFLSISQARKWISGFNSDMKIAKDEGFFFDIVGFCANTGGYVLASSYRSKSQWLKADKIVQERIQKSLSAEKGHQLTRRGYEIFWINFGYTWSAENDIGAILNERQRSRDLAKTEREIRLNFPEFSLTSSP